MTAMFIFGTRPEVTKGIGIAVALANSGDLPVVGIATGQQTGLVQQAFADLDMSSIVPVTWTGDSNATGTDAAWRGSLRGALGRLLRQEKMAIVVGVGDTDSVTEAARIASSESVPFVHLEAGIRHSAAPEDWEPEEINRRQISKLASIHCCPTARQRSNLEGEGVDSTKIHVIGDLSTVSVAETWRRRRYRMGVGTALGVLPRSTAQRKLGLCTFHRSTSMRAMDSLAQAFCDCVGMFPDVEFVVCERPDTRWVRFVQHARRAENVTVLPAPSPLDFQALLCRADIVLTDSAGVQQEALILNRPVVALRENIELRGDSPLLEQVRPPFMDLLHAVWDALRAARTPRELDLWLHCQTSDIVVNRAASVIRAHAQTRAALLA